MGCFGDVLSCLKHYWGLLGFSYYDKGFSDESDDDSSIGERDLPNLDSIKNRYHDSTWGNLNSTYAPERIVFQEVAGPSRRWGRMPSFATIFEMFWPLTMLRGIVNETNRYARAPDRNGKLPGRMNWKLLTVQEFKVFLAITLYMGMKRQPNVQSYWYSFPSIFHCPVISKLLSKNQYELLTKCFHLRDPGTYVTNRELPNYDKMGQVREIVDKVRENFKKAWNLGMYLTIDEMMIRYKGIYCPARQYMPKKPQKWDVKVWCLADSIHRYVHDLIFIAGEMVDFCNLHRERMQKLR